MRPIVYADMLFLINFIINIILLKITSVFLKKEISAARSCLAASVGAVYAVCMFFPKIHFLYIFPCKFAVSVIMMLIAMPEKRKLTLLRNTVIFYLVSFTFAGVMLALIFFTDFAKGTSPTVSNGIFYFNISFKILVTASVVSYAIISIASFVFKRNKLLGIKKMKIYLGDKSCEICALSDTGNLLSDPISNTPVVIAEKNELKSLFPEGMPDISNTDTDIKIRVIPYSSVGNENGIMTGFIPDVITVGGRKTKKAIIGLCDSTLSKHGEYSALFNPEIIT